MGWSATTGQVAPWVYERMSETFILDDAMRERLATADVPLHFSAFHPDFKMTDIPSTPAATLQRARRIALQAGLHYVYVGNVHDAEADSTWCPGCGQRVIERDWYELGRYGLDDAGRCTTCASRSRTSRRWCAASTAAAPWTRGRGHERPGRRRLPLGIGAQLFSRQLAALLGLARMRRR